MPTFDARSALRGGSLAAMRVGGDALADRVSRATAAVQYRKAYNYCRTNRLRVSRQKLAIAAEVDVRCTLVRAGDLIKTLDLAGLLSNLRKRDFLVIEDVDVLGSRVMPYLTEVLSEGYVYISVGIGPDARVHKLPVPPFTFVGLTTRLFQVEPCLRRWCLLYEFDPYSTADM